MFFYLNTIPLVLTTNLTLDILLVNAKVELIVEMTVSGNRSASTTCISFWGLKSVTSNFSKEIFKTVKLIVFTIYLELLRTLLKGFGFLENSVSCDPWKNIFVKLL